jgi:hypothetical protein
MPRKTTSPPLPHGGSDIGPMASSEGEVAPATVFDRDGLGRAFLGPARPHRALLAAGAVRIGLTTPPGHGAVGKNAIL